MFHIERLAKTFRHRGATTVVFRDITTHIPSNRVTLLTGSNGAGKSTLLRFLAGLEAPDAGHITCFSNYRDPWLHPLPIRERLIWTPETPCLPKHQSVCAHLMEAALWDGASSGQVKQRWGEVKQFFPVLEEISHRPTQRLSKGQKAIVALARLKMFAKREAWLLDEPADGLDETIERHAISFFSKALLSGASLVICTHRPERFTDLNPFVLRLSQGMVLRNGEKDCAAP